MNKIATGAALALLAFTLPANADSSSIPPRFTPPQGQNQAQNQAQSQGMPIPQTAPGQLTQNPYGAPGAQEQSQVAAQQGNMAQTSGAPAAAYSPMDAQAAGAAQEQMTGNYSSLNRSTGVPLGMIQPAWDKPFSNMSPGQGAPGVVRFGWSDDLIMPIRIRDYMITTIMFPKWEKITDVFLGESQYLEASIMRDNVIGLRSAHSGIDTTVMAIGDSGNIYTFYVRAEGYNTKKLTDINVFVDVDKSGENNSMWFKGSSETASAAPATQNSRGRVAKRDDWNPDEQPSMSNIGSLPHPSKQTQSDPTRPAGPDTNMSLHPDTQAPDSSANADPSMPRKKLIFDMRMYEVQPGDRAIAPEYVYSDGVWTYFQYGDKAESTDWPVVFRVVDGIETRVNTRTAGKKGNVLIAEAVGDFVLRNGNKAVCVKKDQSRDSSPAGE